MKINTFLQSLSMGNKVRELSQSTKEKSVSESLLDDLKVKIPNEVKSILDAYKIKPDSETAKGIMKFVEQTEGPLSAKLETIEIALYKGVEPTADHLSQIHQALVSEDNGMDISFDAQLVVKGPEAVSIIEQLKLPEAVKIDLIKKVSEGLSLKEAVRALVLELSPNFSVEGDSASSEITLGRLIRVLKQCLSESHQGRFDGHSDESLIETLDNSKTHSAHDPQNGTTVDKGDYKALPHEFAMERNEDGDVIPKTILSASIQTPKTQTSNALIGEEVHLDETAETLMESDLQVILEAVEAVLAQASTAVMQEIDMKVYLIETTTESMISAKQAFESFKQETIKLLEQTLPEKQSVHLEKAIESLNQIILKGDVTKYTDMLTEKKLLVMSADLDKAQLLLKQGDFNKALEVVKSAKALLEGISYNPSLRRVQLFTQNKMNQLEDVFEKPEQSKVKMGDYIRHQVEPYKMQGVPKSASDVLEVLRFLGLNHEMEVAEGLERKTDDVKKEWAQGNIKEILLKLMKENREEKTVERTSESLMQLNGQQMMNDSQSQKQPFHFFNMPFVDGEEIGQMKIYMKGHHNNQQMDWKNTEMYFGMQLKKHGPLGIKVKIHDQIIDMEVLSDSGIDFKSVFEPVLDALAEQGFNKGEIKSTGYRGDKGIHLKPMTTPSTPQASGESFSQKGFDFKI